MALLKRADSDRMPRPALVLDLGDLRRQAEDLERRTRERAGEIIEQGRTERAKLLAGAEEQGHAAGREKGFAQGLEEGRTKGRAEAIAALTAEGQALQRAWEASLGEFLTRRDEMLSEARTDVLLLALMIARRVVKRVVDVDPRVVEDQLAAALALTIRPTSLVIEVHPDDAALANEVLPGIVKQLCGGAHAALVPDPARTRGSVVIRTAGGEVDASIDTQIGRIVEAIVPAAGLERARRALDDATEKPGSVASADQEGAS
jgi:flagellar assembly protein FliH